MRTPSVIPASAEMTWVDEKTGRGRSVTCPLLSRSAEQPISLCEGEYKGLPPAEAESLNLPPTQIANHHTILRNPIPAHARHSRESGKPRVDAVRKGKPPNNHLLRQQHPSALQQRPNLTSSQLDPLLLTIHQHTPSLQVRLELTLRSIQRVAAVVTELRLWPRSQLQSGSDLLFGHGHGGVSTSWFRDSSTMIRITSRIVSTTHAEDSR